METTTFTSLFDAATRVHRTQPTGDTAALVATAALLMMGTPAQAPTAPPVLAPVAVGSFTSTDTHEGQFVEIRATFDRLLTPDEALTAAACTGYALKKYFNGDEVGEPILKCRTDGTRRYAETLMSYDSAQGKRTDPNIKEAFELAAQYIADGTPVRISDRAGRGTKGTRLSEGIGPVGVRFEVR